VEAGQALDHQPRPGVCAQKGARNRLIRLAASHPEWVLGFADEVWWSRLAQPALHAWVAGDESLRLQELTRPKEDPEPKALACYGLLLRARGEPTEQVWLRFVEGRPISAQTLQFLAWCLGELAEAGKSALLLVWDNASWHNSGPVRQWIKAHNRQVKRAGQGVRVVVCPLPTKSPWLNPIEPKWVHGKRRVMEPARLLTAKELRERVYDAFGCPHLPSLPMPQLLS
jgi:transposase